MTAYLTHDEALALHAESIRRFGGDAGIRDMGLLDAALAMASASFAGQDLHESLAEKAAAYLFHVAKNHPFVDGNKRAALACAIMFLGLNGYRIAADPDDLVMLTLAVASGGRTKADAAVFIEAHIEGTP